jgi:hypothetical protein
MDVAAVEPESNRAGRGFELATLGAGFPMIHRAPSDSIGDSSAGCKSSVSPAPSAPAMRSSPPERSRRRFRASHIFARWRLCPVSPSWTLRATSFQRTGRFAPPTEAEVIRDHGRITRCDVGLRDAAPSTRTNQIEVDARYVGCAELTTTESPCSCERSGCIRTQESGK